MRTLYSRKAFGSAVISADITSSLAKSRPGTARRVDLDVYKSRGRVTSRQNICLGYSTTLCYTPYIVASVLILELGSKRAMQLRNFGCF